MRFTFEPIGEIHSPFKTNDDIHPERNKNPEGYADIEGRLEISPDYTQGLQDIEGFSHLIVIFAFHLSQTGGLISHPPFDTKPRGVFATRSPHRPNALGQTVVRLVKRNGRSLHVKGLDMLDGTPILDIKPYTPRDQKPDARFGWLEKFLQETP
jgi:tRNA-Thr(GGU) m(6)t(6)A37 methyltransferase TsaA